MTVKFGGEEEDKRAIDCWQEIAVVRQMGMENASEEQGDTQKPSITAGPVLSAPNRTNKSSQRMQNGA